jgi:hypothetical protein
VVVIGAVPGASEAAGPGALDPVRLLVLGHLGEVLLLLAGLAAIGSHVSILADGSVVTGTHRHPDTVASGHRGIRTPPDDRTLGGGGMVRPG